MKTYLPVLLAVVLAASSWAQEKEIRPAAVICREFRSVQIPSMSRDGSPEARAAHKAAVEEGCAKKAALALELYRSHPRHEEVPELMKSRWAVMANALGQAPEVMQEVNGVLKSEESAELRQEACFAAVHAALLVPDIPLKERRQLVDRAFELYPDDVRCGYALGKIATEYLVDTVEMKRIAELILEHYPVDAWATAPAKGLLKLLKRIGQVMPLDLEALNREGEIPTVDPEGRQTLVVIRGSTFDQEELAAQDAILKDLVSSGLRVVEVFSWKHKDGQEGLLADIEERGLSWPVHYAGAEMKSPFDGPWAANRVPVWFLLNAQGVVQRVGYELGLVPGLVAGKVEKKRTSKKI